MPPLDPPSQLVASDPARGRDARLRQMQWRLARLASPMFATEAEGRAPGLPLPAEEAVALAIALLEALHAAHVARVTGLRFRVEGVVQASSGWRCPAPELVPSPPDAEAARREDLAALAPVLADLAPDDRLALAAGRLTALEGGAWTAWRAAMAALGRPVGGPAPWLADVTWPGGAALAELVAALDRTFREGQCEVVWLVDQLETRVEGLTHALAAEAIKAGGRVIVGRCRTLDEPLGPLLPVLRELLALAGHPVLPPEWAPLSAILPELGPCELPALSPPLARLRLFGAVMSLLVSADAPLAVVLDRFDRAEPLTRALIDHMRTQALPVLVALGGPEPGPAEPAARLRLGLLSAEEVARQAESGCGVPLGPATLERCRLASEGDPALLARLCQRWLREGALVQVEDGTWHAREGAPDAPPAGPTRDMLRALAMLEGEADVPTLAAMTDLSLSACFEAVEAALEAGWVREAGAGLRYMLPREEAGCVAAIPPHEAEDWHCRAAIALAGGHLPTVRAHHALLAGTPEAAALALEAGERLLAMGALAAAAALLEGGYERLQEPDALMAPYTRALAVLALEQQRPERAAGLARTLWHLAPEPRHGTLLGQALRAQGDAAGAIAILEAVSCDDPAEEARRGLELAHAHLDRGDVAAGQARAEAALSAANRLGDVILRIEGHLALGRAMLMGPTEDVPRGLHYLEAVFELAFPAGHLEAACLAYRWLGHAQLALSQLEPAYASFAEERELARLLGRPDERARSALDVAWTALTIGYFEQAEQALDMAEADIEAAPAMGGRAKVIRAIALMMRGYLHDPLRLLDAARRQARKLGDAPLEALALGHQVYALLFLGKFGRARQICEEALARAAAGGDGEEALRLRLLLAEVAWRQGDREASAAALEAVRAEAVGSDLLEAGVLLGQARLASVIPEDARPLAERGLTLARQASWLLGQAELLAVAGEAAEAMGDAEAAEAAYDAMLSAADLMGCPHHRAIALAGLSRLAGEPGQAAVLRARAAENLNVYLEQLSDVAREDFMRVAERQRVLARPAPAPSPGAGPHAARPVRKAPEDAEGPRLEDLLGTIHPRLPLDEITARLAEALMRLSHASRTMVYLLNEEGELKLRHRREAQDRLSVLGHDEACRWALERAAASGQTLWVADAAIEPEYADLREIRQQGIRGLLAIPLVAVDAEGERVIGCLYGDSQAPWLGVSDRAIRILEHLARYVGVVLEVGLLQDESSRKTHRLEMLNQLSRVIAGTLDLDRLLGLALGQILQITHGEEGYVFFGEDLACRASMDSQGRPLAEVHVSQGVIARVKRDRQPLAILDVGLDSELQARASLMARNVRSVMCVPLLADDRLVGLIYISSPTANRTFTRHDLDLMTAISSQVALALQNAQAYETIKELNVGLEEKVRERTAELSDAYQHLKETQDQLVEKEKLATIGTLAAGVAHEINNPLGAILTNAQLIGLDVDDPEVLDSLALIEEGARRCKEIVAALLRYAKEDRSHHAAVDMRAIAEEALLFFERQLRDARIEVEADVAPVPAILGDATDMRQLMANLILNAMDAIQARHGGAGGHMTLHLSRELAGVVLTVADDGAGMSADVQRRMFDPFFTTKKVGSGQGLGLSVCQRVVELHGGTIQVQSTEGEGATFRIVLPVP